MADANAQTMVSETVQRAGILLAAAVILVYVWHRAGRHRWRAILEDRFIYGIPWGSLVTLVGVVGFYLFAQSGLTHWDSPVVLPFRSWSYGYVTGWLSAGFAHAGPNHLVGNVLGALVLTPIVEYAWGHYPPSARASGTNTKASQPHSHPPPSDAPDPPGDRQATGNTSTPSSGSKRSGLLGTPWLRALVVFPLAILAVSVLTSLFAFGWSLGYSGTVFFLLGFALVVFPVTTVVAVVVTSGVNVLFQAMWNPVFRVTADPGGPSPPAWAGVNIQAHLLGFLLGVLVAFLVLRHRDQWPSVERVALATVLVVLVRNLWLIPTSSGGEYVQWRAIGVVFALCLAFVIIALVAMDDQPILGLVTTRGVVLAALLCITVLIALPSLTSNLAGMDEDPVPGEGELVVADYTVTYEEDAPHARIDSNASGVIVVSEQRDIWSSVIDKDELAHEGAETVPVGGIGWREAIAVDRTGWDVVGNGTVYAVDLEHDDTRVRSFTADPLASASRIANHSLSVEATPTANERFSVAIDSDGDRLGAVHIPAVNGTATVGDFTVSTTDRDGTETVFVERGDTRVQVAQRE